VDVDGNATYTGFSSGGGAVGDAVAITAPTAQPTATPAFQVTNLGLGVLARLVDGTSEVFRVNNNGDIVSTLGSLTLTSGNLTMSSGAAAISAPTAQPTQTPALQVTSAGVGVSFRVVDGASEVFRIENGGNVVSAGSIASLIKTSTIVTDTAVAMTSTGTYYNDIDNSGAISITLAAASPGAWVCFQNISGEDWTINVDDADQIVGLTDAAGDKITNSTATNCICLYAADATNWVPFGIFGTWADAD